MKLPERIQGEIARIPGSEEDVHSLPGLEADVPSPKRRLPYLTVDHEVHIGDRLAAHSAVRSPSDASVHTGLHDDGLGAVGAPVEVPFPYQQGNG
jgi:hypothetical protein